MVFRQFILQCNKTGFSTRKRYFSTTLKENGNLVDSINHIRNIGILAHIDAGKTTTTERMLFYSGEIRRMGEVHDGNTVMDFMRQERERGITIASAAISFKWNEHCINLIDTPGHVDFTVEVERSVRVLDGAVAIFDAVAGVEAQSETVWRQADRYSVPRIAFINKMDRTGADAFRTVQMMEDRLGALPLVLQHPIGDGENFRGNVDLLSMEYIQWQDKDGENTRRLPVVPGAQGPMLTIYNEAMKARKTLIEKLADMDDEIAELYLLDQPISQELLKNSIRKLTLDPENRAIPTFFGSALKNKGVQPVLDAVVDFLPSPLDLSPFHAISYEKKTTVQRSVSVNEPMTALVFKVKYDKQKGSVVYFRVYSGSLKEGSILYNTTRSCKERITRLYGIHADSTLEVAHVSAGGIGAAVGLKHTSTGDTITLNNETQHVVLSGVNIPEPVFTRSIEAGSSTEQKQLDQALLHMQLEDPSFVVTQDEETGQTLVSGMGELHLEIIVDRLKEEFHVSPTLGPMRVAYRESICGSNERSSTLDATYGTTKSFAKVKLMISSNRNDDQEEEDPNCTNQIYWKPSENNNNEKVMPPLLKKAVEDGVSIALGRGPILGYPLMGLRVEIDPLECEWNSFSNAAAFQICAINAVREVLNETENVILEPIMKLEIRSPENRVGDVLSDLNSQRRALIQDVSPLMDATHSSTFATSIIQAQVPLSEMIGYSTDLRSKTQGECSFSMSFLNYAPVGKELQKQMIINPPVM